MPSLPRDPALFPYTTLFRSNERTVRNPSRGSEKASWMPSLEPVEVISRQRLPLLAVSHTRPAVSSRSPRPGAVKATLRTDTFVLPFLLVRGSLIAVHLPPRFVERIRVWVPTPKANTVEPARS